ncbi:MAG: hypothetical protein LBM68_00365 [Bacteroidales bacterium]|jgi:hypothetical protein|nr:hypothetical protein [Bacteroidales bacterium]
MESKTEEIKNHFLFLEDYGLTLYQKKTSNSGSCIEFKGNGIKVHLVFDYKELWFYFSFFRGEELEYSDAAVWKEIFPFYALGEKYDKNFNWKDLQPEYVGYKKALENNVLLLKQYGYNILTGKEWF